MADRLAGKIAVITGAATGLGQGAALLFAREGATVVAVDLDQAGLAETVKRAKTDGTTIEAVSFDLTGEAGAKALMDHVIARHGRIDSLVTAAGFVEFAPVGDMTLAQWQRTMKGELDIVFLPVTAAWPHMVAQGGGSIVNFASLAAWNATPSLGAAAHAAGKGGILAFTRQLAFEGAPHGIRANTVSPGAIQTVSGQMAFDHVPGFKDAALNKSMIRRHGTAEDVAWALVYLCSDEASWVTGTDLTVDGGASAW
ncbi:SDR family oxidoreductase [Sphingobium sp. JS3065]|jgi:NAD(P)-dependent dehydrogenase (short-subunit alcohol dehydrogenase family)|uniref:SDR family NAD(P)-dependent oxidoreductase n=1 Tax=Sphingobium sp. JS3065 TaxID=2970925 RepID=UPI002264297D|nr:SDR family oxidoreductase [Sphingobium sp. JS3065]UZW57473.1 SDR family oxidoreductase [Sphingobium sp. JS3065]